MRSPLIEGHADLGPMEGDHEQWRSRALRSEFGCAPARLTVAVDAIAVYVNKHNPLTRVSFRELDAIFSVNRKLGGDPIRNWVQLGLVGAWARRTVVLKAPSPTQGIYGVFRSTVVGGGDHRLDMRGSGST